MAGQQRQSRAVRAVPPPLSTSIFVTVCRRVQWYIVLSLDVWFVAVYSVLCPVRCWCEHFFTERGEALLVQALLAHGQPHEEGDMSKGQEGSNHPLT